jgi:hypothetical protein
MIISFRFFILTNDFDDGIFSYNHLLFVCVVSTFWDIYNNVNSEP